MGTLLDLASRMQKLKADLPKQVSLCCVQTALKLEWFLLIETPVDTSNALSNWQGSLDEPINVEITPYVPGSMGLTKLQSANEAYQVLVQKLANKKPGQIIYLSNNAPYIKDLNNGTSKQAPAGFVESCVMQAKQFIKEYKMVL